ncbi:hypothetical protein GCM10011297_28980 [Bacterioplanes sanyensis]|uniref:hypothetical protein n=1 Tax=Bacterioplanes sanyensis TaxID=1249553 RepID=UPI001679A131|nr:hypothetical protein [Bacterioplanes sanyensis]GGY54294.1 hypothetical protein GCM10011297_28980 [Bacterioplanes sanyensis]
MRDLLAAGTEQRSVRWSFDARARKAFDEQQLMDEVMDAYRENKESIWALAGIKKTDDRAIAEFEKQIGLKFSVEIGEI